MPRACSRGTWVANEASLFVATALHLESSCQYDGVPLLHYDATSMRLHHTSSLFKSSQGSACTTPHQDRHRGAHASRHQARIRGAPALRHRARLLHHDYDSKTASARLYHFLIRTLKLRLKTRSIPCP
jgi:hypothetical protein